MTTWWVQHADPHLRILMDPKQGPFADCSPEGPHAVAVSAAPQRPVRARTRCGSRSRARAEATN
ncbi:DUF4913 domain-containing protein [Streptomyces lavendulae]|uniref:DUF4913 domain-containing protein n=1 Tax=Streptomyces lavendulae TaxID=1914 RepID=UPI0036D0F0FA